MGRGRVDAPPAIEEEKKEEKVLGFLCLQAEVVRCIRSECELNNMNVAGLSKDGQEGKVDHCFFHVRVHTRCVLQ